MKLFARICSTIFHPLIMATVGIFLSLYFSYMRMLGTQYIINISFMIVLLTIAIPSAGVLLLYKTKHIKSIGLVNRTERTLPYLLFFVCYVAGTIFLWFSNLRGMQLGFFIGGLLAIAIDLLVNRWWKISVHMTAIGCLTGLIFVMSYMQYIMYTEYIPYLQVIAVISSGALGTSRILLRRHTIGQVCCGFINGFFWVFVSCLLATTLQYIQ
ncbi:MAG: hypothetical protein J6U55_01885 [Bacteroidaceae bacterium]|jgi:hypothetical protein|nr:hypothetical protein [Bacteroidaceae bacterium]MBQ5776478.1 hypothetical protein [Bacteroidaceae bacterium]MBR5003146.1 hypothetical protein [Bacteroidaceae bacterium]